jgi:hypothetical protein
LAREASFKASNPESTNSCCGGLGKEEISDAIVGRRILQDGSFEEMSRATSAPGQLAQGSFGDNAGAANPERHHDVPAMP